MDLLIPTSLVYDAIYDPRREPKIMLGVIVTASGTIFYVYGFGPVEIIIYSLLSYECLVRALFYVWVAYNIYIWYRERDTPLRRNLSD